MDSLWGIVKYQAGHYGGQAVNCFLVKFVKKLIKTHKLKWLDASSFTSTDSHKGWCVADFTL